MFKREYCVIRKGRKVKMDLDTLFLILFRLYPQFNDLYRTIERGEIYGMNMQHMLCYRRNILYLTVNILIIVIEPSNEREKISAIIIVL